MRAGHLQIWTCNLSSQTAQRKTGKQNTYVSDTQPVTTGCSDKESKARYLPNPTLGLLSQTAQKGKGRKGSLPIRHSAYVTDCTEKDSRAGHLQIWTFSLLSQTAQRKTGKQDAHVSWHSACGHGVHREKLQSRASTDPDTEPVLTDCTEKDSIARHLQILTLSLLSPTAQRKSPEQDIYRNRHPACCHRPHKKSTAQRGENPRERKRVREMEREET